MMGLCAMMTLLTVAMSTFVTRQFDLPVFHTTACKRLMSFLRIDQYDQQLLLRRLRFKTKDPPTYLQKFFGYAGRR